VRSISLRNLKICQNRALFYTGSPPFRTHFLNLHHLFLFHYCVFTHSFSTTIDSPTQLHRLLHSPPFTLFSGQLLHDRRTF